MRQTVALIVAIILGLIAVFAMKSYISKEKKEIKREYDQVSVAVAKRSLPKGTTVTSGVITFRDIPAKYAKGMLLESKAENFYGKQLIRNLERSAPIWASDVVSVVRKRPKLQSGERLVTLNVNQESGVGGLIRPKSRVDILYVASTQRSAGARGTKSKTTTLLLSRVPVYAIDNQTELRAPSRKRGSGKYSSITLIVSPAEASVLVSAQSSGSLIFTLRNDNDPAIVTNVPVVSAENIEEIAKALNEKRQAKK